MRRLLVGIAAAAVMWGQGARVNGVPNQAVERPVNAQTGTSYTFVSTDCGKRVTLANASAIAATLPQAGASFPDGCTIDVVVRGAGTVTITPTTSTVNGAATLVLSAGQGAVVVSDGANYTANLGAVPFARTFSLQAGGCAGSVASSSMDLPTSNAPTASCHGTTYVFGTLDFADSANQKAMFQWRLPAGWTGAIDVDLDWYTSATSSSSKWTIETACVVVGTTDATAPSFNSAQTITTTSAGTTNALNRSSQSSVTTTGCSAGNLIIMRIGRDVTDTNTSTLSLESISVTYRVTPQA